MTQVSSRFAICLVLATIVSQWGSSSSRAHADLVGLFQFDGRVNDATGTIPRLFGRISGYTDGTEGQAVSLRGGLNYLFIPISPVSDSRPVQTLGAWVRSAEPTSQQGILTIEDFDSATTNRSIGLDDGGGSGWQYSAVTGPGVSGGPESRVRLGDAPDGDWTFVAARYDGANVTFFVDGQSITAVDDTAMNPNRNRYLQVGTFSFGSGFVGDVDNLFVFDEALSNDQVETIRLGGSAGIFAVAIPEPSTTALGFFLAAAICLRRSRRR